MTQIITRMFGTQEDAARAVALLKENRFGDVHLVARPAADAAAGTADDGIAAALAKAGIPASEAETCAAAVRGGATLVTVHAPFGYAVSAMNILARCNPIEGDGPSREPRAVVDWQDAAPLSNAVGMPVLLDHNWSLSSLLDLTILSKGSPFYSWFGFSLLSNNPAPLSSKLGMALLSDNPAPLSAKAGMALLSDNPTPLSTKAGMALLSDDPTPLSRKLGMRLLSTDPAPLSAGMGMKVLSGDPAAEAVPAHQDEARPQ